MFDPNKKSLENKGAVEKERSNMIRVKKVAIDVNWRTFNPKPCWPEGKIERNEQLSMAYTRTSLITKKEMEEMIIRSQGSTTGPAMKSSMMNKVQWCNPRL